MEGVEFQLRTQLPGSRRYPLLLDERLREGDQFRASEEKLAATLQSIEEHFSSPKAGPHTGTPSCDRCTDKKRQLWRAYHDFYLGNEPNRWDSSLYTYRDQMARMLGSIPDGNTLEDVHRRFEQELREHLRRDLSTPRYGIDDQNLLDLKNLTSFYFEQGRPTTSILTQRLDAELSTPGLHPQDAIEFISSLQASKTSEDRIQIYVKYYCAPHWSDSAAKKNIKAKYARLFERGLSHDTVLAMWKAEALESQTHDIVKLRHRLGELKMAQSAHLRSKAKRAEKDQRMQDREYVFVQRQTARCGAEYCEREISLAEGEEVLECALCEWLAGKDRTERRQHAYYCSEEHIEEDFEYHDRKAHSCITSNDCIYSPEPGPEETGQGGICPDCMDHGIISYFCSQDCYRNNLESHCDTVHYQRDIQRRTDFLEVFRPAPELDAMSDR